MDGPRSGCSRFACGWWVIGCVCREISFNFSTPRPETQDWIAWKEYRFKSCIVYYSFFLTNLRSWVVGFRNEHEGAGYSHRSTTARGNLIALNVGWPWCHVANTINLIGFCVSLAPCVVQSIRVRGMARLHSFRQNWLDGCLTFWRTWNLCFIFVEFEIKIIICLWKVPPRQMQNKSIMLIPTSEK
jgi:hypothetical protein